MLEVCESVLCCGQGECGYDKVSCVCCGRGEATFWGATLFQLFVLCCGPGEATCGVIQTCARLVPIMALCWRCDSAVATRVWGSEARTLWIKSVLSTIPPFHWTFRSSRMAFNEATDRDCTSVALSIIIYQYLIYTNKLKVDETMRVKNYFFLCPFSRPLGWLPQ